LENMEIHTMHVTWWLVSNKLSIRTCIDDCGPHQTSGEQLFSLSLRWKIANMAGSMGTFKVEQLGIFQHFPPRCPHDISRRRAQLVTFAAWSHSVPEWGQTLRNAEHLKWQHFMVIEVDIPLKIGDINIDQYMGKSNMVNPILINIWHYPSKNQQHMMIFINIHQSSIIISVLVYQVLPGHIYHALIWTVISPNWCYWCPDLSDCPLTYGNPSFEWAQTMIDLGDWC
jgi:hypothetical protein